MPSLSVLLAGATGLVGSHCLDQLGADPDVNRVVVATRRPLPRSGGAKVEQRLVDFELLGQQPDLFKVDAIICTLGTTIKKAGSQEKFRHVDFDYPMAIARAGLAVGVAHFLLVSSLGASAKSRIFYSRIKGELEDALQKVGYPSLTILRPSLLLGNRQERRFGEHIATWFQWMAPAKVRGVDASDVAAVLVQSLHDAPAGVQIIESAEIRERAKRSR